MESVAIVNLGEIYFQQGDYPRALALFEESLSIARQQALLPLAAMPIADLYGVLGDFQKARAGYQKMIALLQEFAHIPDAIKLMYALAELAILEGQDEEAEKLVDECHRMSPDQSQVPAGNYVRGRLAYKRGDYELACTHFESILKSEPYVEWVITASLLLGLAQTRLGQLDAGEETLLRGLKLAYDTGLRYQYPRAIYGYAETARAQGRKDQAVRLAGLIHTHDVSPHEVKLDAGDLLAALKANLLPEVFAAAYSQGESLDMDTVVRQLLDEDLKI